MPLLGTRGAASARAFGFGANMGSPAFLGVINTPSNFEVYGAATDSANNIIYSSTTSGRIIKISSAGVVQWAKTITSTSFYAVAVDASDNIYAVGSTGNNGLIIKFDPTGNILWQLQQNAGNTTWYPRSMSWRAVAVMPNGNVAIAGTYVDNTQASFCCGPVQINIDFGALVVLNSSGTLQWARKFGSTSIGYPAPSYLFQSIGVDTSNNIYVSGSGPSVNSGGTRAVPIIKYNSSGVYQWGYQYKNSSSTVSWDGVLAVAPSGNVYAASPSIYTSYAFMVNSSGTYQWARNFTGASRQVVLAGITTDSDGFAYYGGGAYDPATSDAYDYGLYKFDGSGTLQYARSLGNDSGSSGSNEAARAIALSADGYLSLGGYHDQYNTELITRLKKDGSQTGTYLVGGTNYSYISFGITAVSDTPTVYNAKTDVWPNACDDYAMTYTSPTSSLTASPLTTSVTIKTL